jgi:hypothetical protein
MKLDTTPLWKFVEVNKPVSITGICVHGIKVGTVSKTGTFFCETDRADEVTVEVYVESGVLVREELWLIYGANEAVFALRPRGTQKIQPYWANSKYKKKRSIQKRQQILLRQTTSILPI